MVEYKLGDLIKIHNGKHYAHLENGDIPVYGSGGIMCYVNDFLYDGSAILLPRKGTLNNIMYSSGKIWTIDTMYYASAKECLVNPYYLYRYLSLFNLESLDSGSTLPSMTQSAYTTLKVKLPNILIQQKIVSVLSSLDAKIELNNRINTQLEAMAKTLYNYWFVQFDFPDENGKPYKSSGGEIVYSAELKREIPKGWKNGILDDIGDLVRGVTYEKNDIKTSNEENVIPILRATNITGNVIDLNDMVYVSKENVSTKQLLKKFEILITMSSGSKEHIGKNAFFYYDKEISFGAFCAKIVPKTDFNFYLYSYTQSDFMFDTIKNECLGTNINNLNSSLVNGFRLVLPEINLIIKFNKIVSPLYDKIANNERENKQLSELRDWLLPMLMNGQVRVS